MASSSITSQSRRWFIVASVPNSIQNSITSLDDTSNIFDSSSTLENSGTFIEAAISSSCCISWPSLDFDFLYVFFFFLVPIAANVAFTFVFTLLETTSFLPLLILLCLLGPG